MYIFDDIINAVGSANAAAQQEAAIKEAMAKQDQVYQQQRSDQDPWRLAGQGSLMDLMRLKDDPSSIVTSPGYQFRLDEGQKALERSAAARGGLAGGAFMKGMARYGQGLASDEYNNRWNQLMGVSQTGLSAAQNLGQLGSHYADSMSSLYGAKGNAQAAGTMGITNGISSGIQSLGNLATLGLGGGFSGIGIPGLGGGGGINPGASSMPQSTGYAGNYIPRQGFNLSQLGYGRG